MGSCNSLVTSKLGLQSLTLQSTTEAELIAAVPAMKGVRFCSNMMVELEFGGKDNNVLLYIDNSAKLYTV